VKCYAVTLSVYRGLAVTTLPGASRSFNPDLGQATIKNPRLARFTLLLLVRSGIARFNFSKQVKPY